MPAASGPPWSAAELVPLTFITERLRRGCVGGNEVGVRCKRALTQFEISIDGVPHSYRDRKDIALASAKFLKSRNPTSVVKLKDLRLTRRSSLVS
jgi:hypothetical protein